MVKPGKAQNEHIFSGLAPSATDARTFSIGSFVPGGDITARRRKRASVYVGSRAARGRAEVPTSQG